jgi:hypothetical protein
MKPEVQTTNRRRRGSRRSALGLFLAAFAAGVVATPARAATTNPNVINADAEHTVMNRRLAAALAKIHAAVPAFSRQTGLACSVCHYQFPALTPFGRMFKLNGYTLTGLTPIIATSDSASEPSLKLMPFPPMAAMFLGSVTNTSKSVPGTQNGTAQFPDQASLFIAGALSPSLGIFSQFTYAGADGTFGVDNIDLRYATHRTVSGHDLLFGLTLNNNPGVQDVWNTLAAWGFPFVGSEVAPGPVASTVIDGTLGQAVVGLGAYSLWDNTLYSEISLYRSAPQGAALPIDATGENTTRGVAPYWRVGWQHQFGQEYLMLGTFGLHADLYPVGVDGPFNQYTDYGFDAQYEHPTGAGAVIGRTSWTHETQKRTADFLAGASEQNDNLSTFRANVSVATSLNYGASLGVFATNGTQDAIFYTPDAVGGSANGRPDSQGWVGELTYNAWQNVRIGLQYTAYTKFNGLSRNYDGFGRAAADNNTLYTYLWFAF